MACGFAIHRPQLFVANVRWIKLRQIVGRSLRIGAREGGVPGSLLQQACLGPSLIRASEVVVGCGSVAGPALQGVLHILNTKGLHEPLGMGKKGMSVILVCWGGGGKVIRREGGSRGPRRKPTS